MLREEYRRCLNLPHLRLYRASEAKGEGMRSGQSLSARSRKGVGDSGVCELPVSRIISSVTYMVQEWVCKPTLNLLGHNTYLNFGPYFLFLLVLLDLGLSPLRCIRYRGRPSRIQFTFALRYYLIMLEIRQEEPVVTLEPGTTLGVSDKRLSAMGHTTYFSIKQFLEPSISIRGPRPPFQFCNSKRNQEIHKISSRYVF